MPHIPVGRFFAVLPAPGSRRPESDRGLSRHAIG
jgi:hypothetical protein